MHQHILFSPDLDPMLSCLLDVATMMLRLNLLMTPDEGSEPTGLGH